MKQTINTLDTSTEETTNVVFNNSSVQVASNSSAVKRKQNKENESPAIATVSAIKRKNPSACRQILVSTPEKKMRHNHNTHQTNEIECAKLKFDCDRETDTRLLNVSSDQIDLNKSDLKQPQLVLFKLDTSNDQEKSLQEHSDAFGSPLFDRSSATLASPPPIREFITNQDLAAQLATIQHNTRKGFQDEADLVESVWKENYNLINSGCHTESLINHTPSKIQLDNTSVRVYHRYEFVIKPFQLDETKTLTQTDMEKSFTSPLSERSSSSTHDANLKENPETFSCQHESVTFDESERHSHSAADQIQTHASCSSAEYTETKTSETNYISEETEPDEASILEYGYSLLKTHFSEDELKSGIFGDKKNISRSKTQQPFSQTKIDEFKAKLIERFSLNAEQLDVAWNSGFRVKLNTRLGQIRRRIK